MSIDSLTDSSISLNIATIGIIVAQIVLIQIGYTTQLIFTYSKSKIEPLQKDVKYDQS